MGQDETGGDEVKKSKPAVQYERVCPRGCNGGVHKIGKETEQWTNTKLCYAD